jgi:hypothetical protein
MIADVDCAAGRKLLWQALEKRTFRFYAYLAEYTDEASDAVQEAKKTRAIGVSN